MREPRPQPTIFFRGVVGRLILIDVAVTLALLGLWYAWFARVNRRKATAVLAWVRRSMSVLAEN